MTELSKKMTVSRNGFRLLLWTFLFIVFIFLRTISAEMMIAVLHFQHEGGVSSQESLAASDALRKAFNRPDIVILEPWLIDTMASAQGSLQLLQCREETCLRAIGHLLVVDIVISGKITRKNKGFEITILPVEIKTDIKYTPIQLSLLSLTGKNLSNAFATIPKTIIDQQQSPPAYSTKPDSVINRGKSQTVSNSPKENKFLKRFLLGTATVALIGGVTGGIFYHNKKAENDNPSGPANGENIPLVEMPEHPN